MKFESENLKDFVVDVLKKVNLPEGDTKTIADSLVSANLRGVDSHGVTRLPIYVKRLISGAVNPNPNIKVEKESNGTLLIDGDNGMGQVVATEAIKLGVEKARENGAVYIGVKNSTHFGTGAYFIQQAVKEGMIAYAMSNAPSTMAPWGGIEPYLGTNPYAFGVPAGENKPIIFDMATSVVARGKIISAEKSGDAIPEGWAIDKKGRPTTDAKSALEGSVLPFAGPKGYAISLMIDIMSGVLTGAGFGTHVNNIYGDFDKHQNVGHFFQLINIEQFMPASQFKARVDQMISEIKNARRAEDVPEIYLPGEIEFNTEEDRYKNGIVLGKEVFELLAELGKELGIDINTYHSM